jgi:signal transduction histidine kinase
MRCRFHLPVFIVLLLLIKVFPASCRDIRFNKVSMPDESINGLTSGITQDLQGNIWFASTVSINTKKLYNNVEIRIADNGNGILQKMIDKIFQPFFTTKPTGEGTGLGLSLSYDIVKSHSGEIKINTIAGEGAEFIVQLPTS